MKSLSILMGAIVLIAGVIALNGWLIMILWNFLVPVLVHGGVVINFWQALAMLFLVTMLGGAFRGYQRVSRD